MDCPCYSGKPYKECCERYHLGQAFPSTPLDLMRSRYAAYAQKIPEYIITTTHPDNPSYQDNHLVWQVEILAFCNGTSFTGLDILEVEGNTVTFQAHLIQDGNDTSFKEVSQFARINGRWLYLSGKHI